MRDLVNIFIADPDEPFTCPYDGTRTEMVRAHGGLYVEKCPCCTRELYFEFDELTSE